MFGKFLSSTLSSEGMDLSLLFNADAAKAIGKFLGLVEDLDGKINRLSESEYKAGLAALEQAMTSQKEQESLLREARNRLNKAVHLEKNAKLAMAYLGLAMCHEKLGDETNAKLTLKKITEIPAGLLGSFFKDNKIEQIQQHVYAYLGERSPQEIDTLWNTFLAKRQTLFEQEEKQHQLLNKTINDSMLATKSANDSQKKSLEEIRSRDLQQKQATLASLKQRMENAESLYELDSICGEMLLFQRETASSFEQSRKNSMEWVSSVLQMHQSMMHLVRETCSSYSVEVNRDEKNIKTEKVLAKNILSALQHMVSSQDVIIQQLQQLSSSVMESTAMELQRNQGLLQQRWQEKYTSSIPSADTKEKKEGYIDSQEHNFSELTSASLVFQEKLAQICSVFSKKPGQ